jgi:hypothetical protein
MLTKSSFHRIRMNVLPQKCSARTFDHKSQVAWRLTAISFAALVLSGCGNGLSSVSGNVTLDGKPLRGSESVRVTVMFYPASGRGAPAAAIADENGEYAVATGSKEGLAPGSYVVTLSAVEFIPSNVPGGMPGRKVLTPERYANAKESGLSADIKPGRNTFDFELSSDAQGRS